MWLLIRRYKLVLKFTEERNNLLSGRLEQVCVVHGSHFEGCSLDQLLMEQLAKVSEGKLVVIVDDSSYENLLELCYINLNSL